MQGRAAVVVALLRTKGVDAQNFFDCRSVRWALSAGMIELIGVVRLDSSSVVLAVVVPDHTERLLSVFALKDGKGSASWCY